MKLNISSLILGCMVLVTFSACGNNNSNRVVDSFEIREKEGSYFLMDAGSDRKISRHAFANEALEEAIIQLGEDGGRIHLGKGLFVLSGRVELTHHLLITGDGSGTVIVPADDFQDTCLFYGEELNRVRISELTMESVPERENPLSGIILSHCGSCLVRDVTFIGFPDRGVWLTKDTFLSEVRGCRFADVGKSGVYLDRLDGIGRAGPYIPNLISNCIFFRGGTGIECRRAIVANIVACMVFQSREPAIHIHSHSNSILVSGCRTFQIEKDAVVVDASHEINITGNIFCWQILNGIVLRSVDWGTVSGNNIIDSGNIPFEFDDDETWEYWQERPVSMKEYQYNGLMLLDSCKGLTINGNAIFNWASNPPMLHGIYESEDCSDNLIIGNNINYFTEAGIVANGRGTVVSDNVATAGAHRGNRIDIHSFDTRLIESFIEEIRSRD